MQLIHTVDQLTALKGAGVTIGNFDGVHKGHQALIHRTMEVCRQHDLASVLVTFWPHPRLVVSPSLPHAPLTGREQRLELLAGLGVDYVLELAFTPEMAALAPRDFVRNYLMPMPMRQLVVGYDFSLGRGRSGHADMLRALGAEWGFGLEQLQPVIVDDAVVSSTRLRDAIARGDVWQAARLLGRNYGFSGTVIHGAGRGSGMGFPTANLELPPTLLPATGVYATRVRLDETWFEAVTSVGHNPTFGGEKITVESFLLDTSMNLYGRQARLDFVARLRGEQRFESVDALCARIAADVEEARAILAREPHWQGAEPVTAAGAEPQP